MKIFWIRESLDDDRPNGLTYYDPIGEFKSGEGFKKFQSNCQVSAGTPGFELDQWFSPILHASEPGKSSICDWDYFMCSGTFGAFSVRAIEVLRPFWKNQFELLPAKIGETDYRCLRCIYRYDCLDEERSKITYFEGTQDVMEVEQFAFKQSCLTDPMIFAIPQLTFALFATESIRQIANDSSLKGFDFELVASS